MSNIIASTLAILVLPLPLVTAWADDPSSRREGLSAVYLADAQELDFKFVQDVDRPLALVETPVMMWDTDNDWSGDVYVWMSDRRPQVIGCVLSGPFGEGRRQVYREFHLLSEDRIQADAAFPSHNWQPSEGLRRQLLPGAPPPADSRTARLVQMRALARSFIARMDAENSDWELRLLSQPLFRYEEKDRPVVDGALFTWVWDRGTDPELILMLECHRDASGDLVWRFAPVRFSNRELWLLQDNEEVWRGEYHTEPRRETNTLPYATDYSRSIDTP